MDGPGREDQQRSEERIPAEVYEAAGRAYCLARYNYSPVAYVSDEERERHIARDALDQAQQPSTRAAVDAAVRLIVARYERALREQKRNLEAVHDEAYRGGREDERADILKVLRQREDAAHETYARRQALGVGDQAAEWAVRSRTWRQARQAAEEAAIARGDGVQPTEEQRAVEEDQERDEEQV